MKARVVVTWHCTRHCQLCCNEFPGVRESALPLDSLEPILSAEEVCITGGEPLLVPERVLAITRGLRWAGYARPVWMYTSIYRPALEAVMREVDGIQYTLHLRPTPEDITDFEAAQRVLLAVADRGDRRHNRLKIGSNEPIGVPLEVNGRAWAVMRLRPFMPREQLLERAPNHGVPTGEVFYEATPALFETLR